MKISIAVIPTSRIPATTSGQTLPRATPAVFGNKVGVGAQIHGAHISSGVWDEIESGECFYLERDASLMQWPRQAPATTGRPVAWAVRRLR